MKEVMSAPTGLGLLLAVGLLAIPAADAGARLAVRPAGGRSRVSHHRGHFRLDR